MTEYEAGQEKILAGFSNICKTPLSGPSDRSVHSPQSKDLRIAEGAKPKCFFV